MTDLVELKLCTASANVCERLDTQEAADGVPHLFVYTASNSPADCRTACVRTEKIEVDISALSLIPSVWELHQVFIPPLFLPYPESLLLSV